MAGRSIVPRDLVLAIHVAAEPVFALLHGYVGAKDIWTAATVATAAATVATAAATAGAAASIFVGLGRFAFVVAVRRRHLRARVAWTRHGWSPEAAKFEEVA